MKKRTFFCIVKSSTTTTIERGPYMKDIISTLTMKELERITYRALQESFSQMMAQTLKELDDAIALGRDKRRFYLKDKRTLKFESVFGQVELKRNYYRDKETGKYVYLLDQYLAFDGTKGMSPDRKSTRLNSSHVAISY